MGKKAELSGMSFGNWIVIGESPKTNPKSKSMWLCHCVCGEEKPVSCTDLTTGKSTSCGCMKAIISAAKATKHGGASRPEYKIWVAIKYRCLDSTGKNWANYGSRGITVCDRWINDFGAFIGDMGDRPGGGYSIDRINNDGNYEPGNCRWATNIQQANNRRPKKTHSVKKQTLVKLLETWQKILRLQDWDIKLKVVTNLDGCLARCEPNPKYKTAVITFCTKTPGHLEDNSDLEITLVHELLHIHHSPVSFLIKEDSWEDWSAESMIDQLAHALVALHRDSLAHSKSQPDKIIKAA